MVGGCLPIHAKIAETCSGSLVLEPRHIDPALNGLVVVFNGSAASVDQRLPGMTGANLSLSPVQSAGADAVVKTSTWDGSTST